MITGGAPDGLVGSFLGVEPGAAHWQVADQARRKRILATWLSELEAAGIPLGADAAEYLARARRRVTTLHALGVDLAAAHDVEVLKGKMIARHMPPGVLRQSGDVDLVAPDERTLWQVVLDVRDRCDAVVRSVTVLQGEDGGRHVGAWLKWPAEQPLLDKPMGVDITTCTFAGDLKGVPARVAREVDTNLLSLFAVAEERFQRKYRVKDLIDLTALVPVLEATYGDGLAEVVVCLAGELCLAPELLQLSRKVHQWRELPECWLHVLDELAAVARRERALRRDRGRAIATARYGLWMDDVASDDLALTLHSTSDGELAGTPVGTYLLVGTAVVGEVAYDNARAAAAALHRESHGTREST